MALGQGSRSGVHFHDAALQGAWSLQGKGMAPWALPMGLSKHHRLAAEGPTQEAPAWVVAACVPSLVKLNCQMILTRVHRSNRDLGCV